MEDHSAQLMLLSCFCCLQTPNITATCRFELPRGLKTHTILSARSGDCRTHLTNHVNMAMDSLKMLQSTFLDRKKFYLWQQQRGNSTKILMQHWLLLMCRGCMHCPNMCMLQPMHLYPYSHTFLQSERVEHNAVRVWSGRCASIIHLSNSCINILLLKQFDYQASSASTLLEYSRLGTHLSSNPSLLKIAKEHYWNAMSTSDNGPYCPTLCQIKAHLEIRGCCFKSADKIACLSWHNTGISTE